MPEPDRGIASAAIRLIVVLDLEFTMSITVTYTQQARAFTAILHPKGALDWSTYRDLIVQAWAARNDGAAALIVDLSDVDHIGTAGFVGLHTLAVLGQESQPPDLETGWVAIRALVERPPPLRPLAVVNPRPRVQGILVRTPLADFLTIHTDLDTALAAVER